MKVLSHLLIMISLIFLFLPVSALAKEKILKRDANGDGKSDLWEEYDQSEALVSRSRDLNFDGKPDIEETGSEQLQK